MSDIVKRTLGRYGIEYISAALNEVPGSRNEFALKDFRSSYSFILPSTQRTKFRELDFGGVISQQSADEELVADIQRKYSEIIWKLIFHDPHAKPGDLLYAGQLPHPPNEGGCGNFYVLDLEKLDEKYIRYFRSICVGYLKIIYVTSSYFPMGNQYISMSELKKSVCHIYTNCYDDESWLGANYFYRHE